MNRYKLFLDSGKVKYVVATTPTQAKYKYYGSQDHFRTESAVIKIQRLPMVKNRKRRVTKSLWNLKI